MSLCRYAGCRFSECRYAECHYAWHQNAECDFAEGIILDAVMLIVVAPLARI